MKKWNVAAIRAAKGKTKLGCVTAYDACFARLADEGLIHLGRGHFTIYDIQTLITCTGVEDFINKRFNVNKILKVEKGHVTTELKPQTALIKG